ncbi:MAG: sugar nucleotide-binding protein [Lachnospiraceae bacterium]|nr:sugar nucleotide-binding protein [Lachnospiraceae bacterium]
MKKILLTGDQGFMASRFYSYYRGQYDFILLNRHNMDMTDETQVYNLFKEQSIDIVFHAAAIADIGVCQRDPELARRTNLQATVNIARGCALKNSIMVFASSDQVFSGNAGGGPFAEDDQAIPDNIYAESKLAAEREIAAIVEHYYNLRLTWMFSLPERNKKINGGIILNVMEALMTGNPIELNDQDYRGMTYVYEVIENFEKIIELPSGTFHAGSENNWSVYEIGKVIAKVLHSSHRIEEVIHCGNGPRKDLRISNQKLRSLQVYFSDTEQAIRRCISDFRMG